jgi:hypothetical protein
LPGHQLSGSPTARGLGESACHRHPDQVTRPQPRASAQTARPAALRFLQCSLRLRLTKAPSDQRRCPEPGEICSRKGVRPEPERPRPPHKSLVVPSARRRTSLPTTCRSTGQVRFDPGPVTSHRASMRDGKPVPDVTGGGSGRLWRQTTRSVKDEDDSTPLTAVVGKEPHPQWP